MSRMTRSGIKHEPGMEHHITPTFTATNSTSNTAALPDGTASRAVSVASRSVTSRITPAFEDPAMSSALRNTHMIDTNTVSSGNTTLADEDVDMNCTHNRSASEEDAMQAIAQQSRHLMNVIQKLRELNIDATLPSLPTFVVVGDQSAGKSSIIEAVCDITVPRDQGTCTRCPFQITTSAATGIEEGWVCRVSLHRSYAYTPTARAGKNSLEYDRWQRLQTMEVLGFAVVRDKHNLQDVLRRAQLAILNPQRDHTDFLYGNPSTNKSLGFSPNTVSLRIEGPHLPDLSFYDLPGAINVHEDGDDYLVTFVEKLIKSYLRDPKTLVLLACSADQDVENSTAFRYVSQCKALSRCMGVLTKPDLIGLQRVSLLERVLRGDVFRLRSRDAWFITKQLSQESLDRGATRLDARESEDEFFAGEPWNTALAPFAGRFGTGKLQSAISTDLRQHILRELPDIIARVQSRVNIVATELQAFPQPTKSASHTVTVEYQALVKIVESHLRGDGKNKKFRNGVRGLLNELRDELAATRLVIKLGTPGHKPSLISLESESEDATPAPTPSKKRKANDSRTPQGPSNVPPHTPATGGGGRKERQTSGTEPQKLVIGLEELHDVYTHGSISGLPEQIDSRVTEDIVLRAQAGWEDLIRAKLVKIRLYITAMLAEVYEETLAARRRMPLYGAAGEAITKFFSALWDQGHERILYTLACERHKPLTCSILGPQIEEIKSMLRQDRLNTRTVEYNDTLESKIPKLKEGDRQKQLEAKLKTGDKYGRVLDAVSSALAYYDLASMVLVDNIAKQVEYGLLFAVEQGLDETLRTALHATDEAYCAHLLEEDPEVEAQRTRLQAESERLNAALQELNGVRHAVGL
ncbi:hypothetical protein LTS10_007664 [Elasticomyces elasticus]|nr:hypothetical protein LTS10_007664 [Elasticomyces elasticus]